MRCDLHFMWTKSLLSDCSFKEKSKLTSPTKTICLYNNLDSFPADGYVKWAWKNPSCVYAFIGEHSWRWVYMRVRLSNERPTLHSVLRAKANIKPTQTGESTKQGQAAACASEREREMDIYLIGTGPSAYQSWQLNPTETLRSTGVELGIVLWVFLVCY